MITILVEHDNNKYCTQHYKNLQYTLQFAELFSMLIFLFIQKQTKKSGRNFDTFLNKSELFYFAQIKGFKKLCPKLESYFFHYNCNPSPEKLSAREICCLSVNDLYWHCCLMENIYLVTQMISKANLMTSRKTMTLQGIWSWSVMKYGGRMSSEWTYLNLPWQCWHWSPTHPRSQTHDPLIHFPERQFLSHGFAGEACVTSTK